MPAMTHSRKVPEVENYDFNWGKKRGVGGKKKEVQFYESFTYDGVEYFLYDCVYIYKEGEPEPYIGKLVKIWEQLEYKKKVKVLWFFRHVEIQNWLGDDLTLENEIFLASGEGVGLANVNPLEAIAGKCNVVCTSKDNRNSQPSEEELEMADFIFYRTFNVGNCTISDKIVEEVAGVEVKFIFNRKEGQKSSDIPKLDAERKEQNGKVVASNQLSQLPSKLNSLGALENLMTDDKPVQSVAKEDVDLNTSLVKQLSLPGDNLSFVTVAEAKEIATANVEAEHVLDEKAIPKLRTYSDSRVEVEENLNSVMDLSTLDKRPSKKTRLDSFVKSSEELQPNISLFVHDKDKNGSNVHKKLRIDSDEDAVKVSGTTGSAFENETNSKRVKNSLGQDKDPPKKVKPDDSNGTLPKTTAAHAPEDSKTDGPILEVTRRPDPPWEERMQIAHEQGTLVLLENLDPSYTSTEVEDIIWHGFRENCTAKVVQRTANSSPHSGQAFVIFKSRDIAEMAIRKLDEGCLMLPNGRPLVGSRGTFRLPSKPFSFVGHLVVNKIKLQTQREEMNRAVSASHFSQPNTIEYDMAMEWWLLHSRSDICWRELFKQHGDELIKLGANLKFK